MHVPARRVLFAGDHVFRGGVPFVGQADSRSWIAALDRLLAFDPAVMPPGHGPASTGPRADLQLTRDYLAYLRATMGEAARNMEPFDEVYRRTDWSRFEHLPLFAAANRMNAYNTYLLTEQQAKQRPVSATPRDGCACPPARMPPERPAAARRAPPGAPRRAR